jgi:hypothetical protein
LYLWGFLYTFLEIKTLLSLPSNSACVWLCPTAILCKRKIHSRSK